MNPFSIVFVMVFCIGMRAVLLRQSGSPLTLTNLLWVGPLAPFIKFGGAFLLVSGSLGLLVSGTFLYRYEKTQGTVLYSAHLGRPLYKNRNRGADWPVISYRADGTFHNFNALPTWRWRYHTGESITVFYDRKNFNKAVTQGDLLTWPIEFIVLGGLFFWIGKRSGS